MGLTITDMEKTVLYKHLSTDNYTFIYMESTLFYADTYGLTFTCRENTVFTETIMCWHLHIYLYGENTVFIHIYIWRKHCINGDSYGLRKLYLWRQLWHENTVFMETLWANVYTFTYRENPVFMETILGWHLYRKNTVFMEAIMGWELCVYGGNYGLRTLYLWTQLWAENTVFWRHYGLRTLYLWRQ